uniref:Uncharacterized protein n=1 Tax=Opuntia streptacantha TaxID=393608 RepID=A0A7C9CGZ9_OPUST
MFLSPFPSSLALDLLLPFESPKSSPVSAPTLQPPPLPYKVRQLKENPFAVSSSSPALLLILFFRNFWLTFLTSFLDTVKDSKSWQKESSTICPLADIFLKFG